MENLRKIVDNFVINSMVADIRPFGDGLINDSYFVGTDGTAPDYMLQRINHNIFRDVDLLQDNIEAVTRHIRHKLEAMGEADIDRKVLRFIPTKEDRTYWFDGENYWRMMVFIPDSVSYNAVTPETSRLAGRAFGDFQSMLADISVTLRETIPDFHNMEFRLTQLREAVAGDAVGRVAGVQDILDEIEARAGEMTVAERLYREGKLPKRVSHCDTKVNNMLFDKSTGEFLCVIDLDTVMPSFVFSDYGDFLRTGANRGDEDDSNLDRVEFDMDIFRAFTEGYMEGAGDFLTDIEIENLPYAVALFPYMQAVRFLADHINGDTYYKIKYPEHNLVRTRAQMKLLHSIDSHTPAMRAFIESRRKRQ
jgi:Ser/Thr protein kinase RdoA (MazF antagonist)